MWVHTSTGALFGRGYDGVINSSQKRIAQVTKVPVGGLLPVMGGERRVRLLRPLLPPLPPPPSPSPSPPSVALDNPAPATPSHAPLARILMLPRILFAQSIKRSYKF